jgi:hypothetical protein
MFRPITAALAVACAAATILSAAPASAAVILHDRFVESFTSEPYDCDGLVTATDTVDQRVDTMINLRGSGPFPYFRSSFHGSVVTTNLATGGTFTQVFSNNFTDLKITDNGDGTITILNRAAGGFRAYDQFGKLVLKDPGTTWVAFDVDYNGTPGDPDDDVEVPGTFRIVKPSTGVNDISGQDRDFCTDVLEFTS